MRPTERVLLVATAFLGAAVLAPWTDAATRYVALGALAGLVAGHLNGSQPPAATPASVASRSSS